MHRSTLARPQWRTRAPGHLGAWTLENRLARYGAPRRGTRGNRLAGLHRLGWRRFVNRTRSGLRNNHPRRRCGWRCGLWRSCRNWCSRRGRGRNRRRGSLRNRFCLRAGRRSLGRDRTWRRGDGRGHRRGRWSTRLHRRRSGRSHWWRGRSYNRTSHALGSNEPGRWSWRSWRRSRLRRGWRRTRGRRSCGCRLRLDGRRRTCGRSGRCGCGLLLPRNLLQHIARLRDMRQINLCFDFVGVAARTRRARRRGLCVGSSAEMGPHLLCFVLLDRTRMRLFLSDANFDQDIKNRLALDFQFPGQIVHSNLTHPPFPCPAPLLKSS